MPGLVRALGFNELLTIKPSDPYEGVAAGASLGEPMFGLSVLGVWGCQHH